MSIWRKDPVTGALVVSSNPLQYLVVIVAMFGIIAVTLSKQIHMHTLVTSLVLDRTALALSVLAVVFALSHLRKGKGGIIAFSALIAVGFASLASACLSWNGHDWIIDNQGNGVRLTALGFSLVAVVFLRVAGLGTVEKFFRERI